MFLAILITGGYRGGRYLKSAEIYFPSNNTSCSLPELPKKRGYHTQDGPWACGGYSSSTRRTCDKWSQGNWTRQSLSLKEERQDHLSWATASGVYLMGGTYSQWTSELVKEDGSVEKGFLLKYETRQDKEDINKIKLSNVK